MLWLFNFLMYMCILLLASNIELNGVPQMKKSKSKMTYKNFLLLLCGCIASAVLYAISIKCFIQAPGVNMLAGGASGLALIGSKLLGYLGWNESVVYSIIYFAINFPIFILAFKKIGKWYAIFTVICVTLVSILNMVIPQSIFAFMNLSADTDKLLIAIFAGVLTGLSTGIALMMGTSGGGVDVIITYMGMKRGQKVGFYSFWINGIILLIGGILFKEWAAMLYTIIYLFVSSQVINALYRRNNKKLIKVVTNFKDEMSNMLIEVSNHGVTTFDCEGAYTHMHRYEVQTVVTETQVKIMLQKIHEIDPTAFITILDVSVVKGRFTMPNFQ